jgi:hypothetical protein
MDSIGSPSGPQSIKFSGYYRLDPVTYDLLIRPLCRAMSCKLKNLKWLPGTDESGHWKLVVHI